MAAIEGLNLRSWQAHVDGVVTFAHASLLMPLTFEQRPQTLESDGDADGTFRKVWPAALSFGAHLAAHPELVRGKRVVELGAGSGVAGIMCAAFGAKHVWLTDLPGALPLIETNCARNEHCASLCTIAPCRWGDEADIAALRLSSGGAAFDVVIASELVYKQAPETFDALIETMQALSHERSTVLVVYEFRGELFDDLVFFERMLALYDIEVVQLGKTAAVGGDEDEGCEEYLYIYTPLGNAELSRRREGNASAESIQVKRPAPS